MFSFFSVSFFVRYQHHSMLTLFERVLSIYARPGVNFPLLGGALPFQPRCVDLLSIADVYGGSVAQAP